MSKVSVRKEHHLERVETQFDRFSWLWHDLYFKPQRVNDIVLRDRKDFCLAFMSQYAKPGAQVLDVGCGAGVIALEMAKQGFTVHGVDVASKMIKLCQRLFFENDIDSAKYAFTAGQITDLDLPAQSFDAILASGFLEYQPDELKVMRRLHELLRPGGVMIITAPIGIRITGLFGLGIIYGEARRWIKTKLHGSEDWKKPAGGLSINRYGLSGFKKLLQRAGFSLVDYKRHGYANFWPLQSMELSRQFKMELFLHNNLTRMAKVVPIDRFANEIIAVAKK